MEIAIYARVSTNRQQQNQTIEQQIERLKAKIEEQQGWHLSENHIYCDDGYSGASLNRPGLDRLRDHASLSCFELVVITEPDRLARKYVHQMLLIEELTDVGCKVEFIDRPMSEDPHDHLLLQIRGAVAEYERNLIAERMRRGRQRKLKNGQLLPWTIAPYGYILDAERPRDPSRVQIDPVKSQVVNHIFDCYTDPQKSISIYGLAKQLSEKGIVAPKGGSYWSTSTVRRILCSPSYTGTAYSGRTQPAPALKRKSALQPVGTGLSYRPTPSDQWIAVKVPAIISQEVFDMAQERLEQNKQMSRRNNSAHSYLLRGLVSCGRCQLSCTGRFVNSGYPYYVCNRHTDAFHVVKGERCTARYTPAHVLDHLVWQDLCSILTDPAVITHELERAQAGEWLPQALQSRRRTISATLAQLERQQARLLDIYLAEVITRDEFERKREELIKNQSGLRKQLRQLDIQAQKQIDTTRLAGNIHEFCQKLQPSLDKLNFDQQRQLIELLIDRVIVEDGKVEIRYVIPTSSKGEKTFFSHLRTDYTETSSE